MLTTTATTDAMLRDELFDRAVDAHASLRDEDEMIGDSFELGQQV